MESTARTGKIECNGDRRRGYGRASRLGAGPSLRSFLGSGAFGSQEHRRADCPLWAGERTGRFRAVIQRLRPFIQLERGGSYAPYSRTFRLPRQSRKIGRLLSSLSRSLKDSPWDIPAGRRHGSERQTMPNSSRSQSRLNPLPVIWIKRHSRGGFVRVVLLEQGITGPKWRVTPAHDESD
jgi:hypothetical protein